MSKSIPCNFTAEISATNQIFSDEKLQTLQPIVQLERLSEYMIEKLTKPKNGGARSQYTNVTLSKIYKQVTDYNQRNVLKDEYCKNKCTNYCWNTNSLNVITKTEKRWESSLWSTGCDVNTVITGYRCHGSNMEQVPESVLTEIIHRAISEKLKEIPFDTKYVTQQRIIHFQNY